MSETAQPEGEKPPSGDETEARFIDLESRVSALEQRPTHAIQGGLVQGIVDFLHYHFPAAGAAYPPPGNPSVPVPPASANDTPAQR